MQLTVFFVVTWTCNICWQMNQFVAAEYGKLHTLRGLLTRHNVNDVDEYGMTVTLCWM